MQVYGNIGSNIEQRKGQNGTVFYTFRLAENQGQEPQRFTTWYDIVAFLDEVQADLLSKGQFVCITGRIELEAFMKKVPREPGADPNEPEKRVPAAAVKIITGSVKPVEKRKSSGAPSTDE